MRPNLKVREAARITLAEAGLTEPACTELEELGHQVLRQVASWDPAVLTTVISPPTFAEADAALYWWRIPYEDATLVSTFQEGVRNVREHFEEHGFIPGAREIYNGFRLGQWVMMTRQRFKAGEMDPSRVHFMNQLPYWTWTGGGGGRRGIAPRRLLDILDKAQAFATENGHIDVPPRGEGQASLRRGLEDVRRVFIEQGALSAAAIVDFEALPGWTWNAGEAAERSKVRYATIKIERPPTRQWLARLAELQVVAEGVGGLDKASLNGDRTGHWASTQRVRRKSLSSQQRFC